VAAIIVPYPETGETITIKKEDYEVMLKHCREGLPEESCGLIAGHKDGNNNVIEKVYLLTNVDHSNEHFTMDPKEQLAAVKDARANNLTMLGNFHSHPESPSRPSEEDKKLAYDTNAIYMILSLMEADEPILRGFHVDQEKNVTAHNLVII
jgi:proteasome lid subunit RPN8/RPN11